jgi:hypothetical protein
MEFGALRDLLVYPRTFFEERSLDRQAWHALGASC